MEILHTFQEKEVKGEGAPNLFLSSRDGGFFSLGCPNISQYQGWFHFLSDEWQLYKTIENISIDKEPKAIINTGSSFKRIYSGSKEEFTLVNDSDLMYEITGYTGKINLEIDFRRVHDYDDQGRIYNISKEGNTIIIEFQKFDDNNLLSVPEMYYLAISGKVHYKEIKEWVKKDYSFDQKRGVKHEFYVFRPLYLEVDSNGCSEKIIFSFGKTKIDAIKNSKKNCEKKTIHNPNDSSIEKEISNAALKNLIINFKRDYCYLNGIYAGLPWFYQLWARDELISLAGLISKNKYDLVKEILMRYWRGILTDGRISNRYPYSQLGSADGIGWLYYRTLETIRNLSEKNILDHFFDIDELNFILNKLNESIKKIEEAHMKENMICNHELETWMDTHEGGHSDVRDGGRVEIQALHLSGYSLFIKLSELLGFENQKIYEKETDLKRSIREHLITNGILRDGMSCHSNLDMTTRPNVFLAYYVYPNLLIQEEWERTFDNLIEDCWLEWGGFSSIEKTSYLFQPRHTGINNKSYHRGDSWYFLNNIAAICMLRLNKDKYFTHIEKIKNASIKEMMFSGLVGQCAELSSAAEQTSEGCLAQAWSASTLIELLNSIDK